MCWSQSLECPLSCTTWVTHLPFSTKATSSGKPLPYNNPLCTSYLHGPVYDSFFPTYAANNLIFMIEHYPESFKRKEYFSSALCWITWACYRARHVLVGLNWHKKIPQTGWLSHFITVWRLEKVKVKMSGVSKFDFFWGLFPRMADDSLLAVSSHGLSLCMYVSVS